MRKYPFWALPLVAVVFAGSAASAAPVAPVAPKIPLVPMAWVAAPAAVAPIGTVTPNLAPAAVPALAAPAALPASASSGAQECQTAGAARELEAMLGVAAKGVPACHGNDCKKNSDCRPAELPECAFCLCIGPLGDKFCSCQ